MTLTKKIAFFAAFFGTVALSSQAFAQGRTAPSVAPGPKGATSTAQPAAAAGTTTSTTSTSEYVETRTTGGADGSNVVIFKEDLVGAGGANPFGSVVLAPPNSIRVGLLRPRFNFVSEMLKSVENL